MVDEALHKRSAIWPSADTITITILCNTIHSIQIRVAYKYGYIHM